MAIAAVDIALWDLKAKVMELPLVKVLGQVQDDVAVYGSGGFTSLTDDQLANQLGGWAHGQGIPRVKMKVGEAWGRRPERDLERAQIARTTIGEHVELFVDANGGYSTKQAVRMANDFAALGVTWFEEPVSSDHLSALAANSGTDVTRRCRRRVWVRPLLFPGDVRSGRRRLPAGRRLPLRGNHRVATGRSDRRDPWTSDLRSLRPIAPPPSGLRDRQHPPSRVLRRPRPSRPPAFRWSNRSRGWRAAP